MLFNGVYVLWEDPLVLSCFGRHDRARFLSLKVHADILCFPAWLQTWTDIHPVVCDYAVGRARGKRLHFMSNSPEESRVLGRLPLPGAFVSQNAYVNEHTFRPTGTCKRFDAVYTAQMQAFKRMQLAAKIPSLFVVTYGDMLTPEGEYDLHRFAPGLAHADYNRRWVNFDEINTIYNRSRVGLALSECEGAMLSSVEYMLAGLPMVSTPCRGGREVYFDDRFVLTVDPTPQAVAAGVSELIRREIDPEVVRDSTIRRLAHHRLALCEYVQKIVSRAGAVVPTVDRLYERIFGGENGTNGCFVHSKTFASRGWI